MLWKLFHTPTCVKLVAIEAEAMDSSHPLAVAARRYLSTGAAVATEEAKKVLGSKRNAGTCKERVCCALLPEAGGHALLHSRSHLSLSTRFSGMGGGEMAAFLAGATTNVRFHLLTQCDVIPEAFEDARPQRSKCRD